MSYIAGVDGCKAGWIAFKIDLESKKTSLETIKLPRWLTERPSDLACVAIDIPIGLLDRPRACDIAARKRLGRPRASSVFPPPCRAALEATNYEECCAINYKATTKKVTKQTWGIAPKIKEVDDAITPECQTWALEVHPEVSFWALAGQKAMRHKKKSDEGHAERLALLRKVFPAIDTHLSKKLSGVGKDDLLDAAVAGWTALRIHSGEAQSVCDPELDEKRLAATIWY